MDVSTGKSVENLMIIAVGSILKSKIIIPMVPQWSPNGPATYRALLDKRAQPGGFVKELKDARARTMSRIAAPSVELMHYYLDQFLMHLSPTISALEVSAAHPCFRASRPVESSPALCSCPDEA